MEHRASPRFRRADLLAGLAIAALAVALRLLPGPRLIDDAYITYRYARNIAEGVGFVYNPGEHVLGTTTPLYTLLLALLGSITGSASIPALSVVLNALADGVSALLLYGMARRLFGSPAPGVLLGLLWAVAPRSVTFATGGMETSLTTTLMLGAFAAWLADRTTLAAALTAFATLARPDVLIWAGPLAVAVIVQVWQARRNRPLLLRLPWWEGGLYAAILLPWIAYATLTFGSPLPHSIAAKAVAYLLPPTQALVTLIQQFSTPFFEFDAFGPPAAMAGAAIYPLLALLGALFLFHADRRTLPLAIYPWLFFATYALANPLMFRWYAAPALVVYMLCIVAGAWGLAVRIAGAARSRWVLAAVGAFWLGLSLNAWTLHPDHGPDRPAPEMAWIKLELLYEQVGRSLAPLVSPATVIAAGDIGALGWYSGARILDTLGLISPEASAYYPIDPSLLATTAYAVAPDLIIDEQPYYVVILETYGRNGLLKDDRFAETYHLREAINTDIYGSEGMLVFERIAP